MPIRLLPADKRQAMTALYAFCRRADDITDGPQGDAALPATAELQRARDELTAFRGGLAAALKQEDCTDPVLRAMADAARRYAIPSRALYAVLDGVEQDLDLEHRQHGDGCLFEGNDQLQAYCRRVASAVGLASIHIWGFSGPEALPAADACGLAFQMTNILRDVTEDLARGRVYLPREDLQACGVSVADLQAAAASPTTRTPGLEQLLALQRARTSELYTQASALDRFLSRDGRRIFRAMFGVYRSLFEAVCLAGNGILQGRPKPSRLRLAASVAATSVCGPRSLRATAPASPLVVSPKQGPDGEPLPIVIVGEAWRGWRPLHRWWRRVLLPGARPFACWKLVDTWADGRPRLPIARRAVWWTPASIWRWAAAPTFSTCAVALGSIRSCGVIGSSGFSRPMAVGPAARRRDGCQPRCTSLRCCCDSPSFASGRRRPWRGA